MHRGRALWVIGIVILGLLPRSASLASADEQLPRPPLKDFSDKPGCEVIEVRDGDVLVVRVPDEAHVIRLIGVEIPKRDGRAEEARAFLARLLAGESVYLEYEPDRTQHDIAGRTWAYVYRAPDGLFVNLELVRQGYARVGASGRFNQEPLLRAYEQMARKARKGLWAPRPGGEAEDAATSEPAVAAVKRPAAAREKATTQPTSADDLIVYVTGSGRKYHTKDCQFTRHGATAMAVKEAKARGCTACAKCKPPE